MQRLKLVPEEWFAIILAILAGIISLKVLL